jgi:hypothetical protein
MQLFLTWKIPGNMSPVHEAEGSQISLLPHAAGRQFGSGESNIYKEKKFGRLSRALKEQSFKKS